MKAPGQIQSWLDANTHRMDLGIQFRGDEPNAVRRDWDTATARWCLIASWPYEAAAGNQSIPAVYKAIHDADDTFLCDRFYLPATPGDMRLMERNDIPVFGIESKHPITDFDVVATSISYPVLSMSFLKMLTMSGIPARWKDRYGPDGLGLEQAAQHPMVIVGGLSYGAPEVLAPVVDCWFLGEAEDEPGNPGIGEVTRRISAFKRLGRWSTDRVGCYADLAREFNFLYFPRFVDVKYQREDRSHVGIARPSKQVSGYVSLLDGMRMPFRKRHVRDLDAIKPLDNPPLLYADPSMGSGDLEAARGCPAWCSFCALCVTGDTQVITKLGIERLDRLVGEKVEVWTSSGWTPATVDEYGVSAVDEITFAPAMPSRNRDGEIVGWKKTSSKFTIKQRATELHRWPLVDGSETHHLAIGDVVKAEFVNEIDDQDEYDAGWRHGFVFGDGTRENGHLENSNCYAAVFFGNKREYLSRFDELKCDSKSRRHDQCDRAICVTSTNDDDRRVRLRMNSHVRLKEFPDNPSSSYVRGFIEGWAAADGAVKYRREDRIRLTTQLPTAEEWFRTYGAYGGWVLSGRYQRGDAPTNYGARKNPLVEFCLTRTVAWKVVSIDKAVSTEPVYCATVPGEGFFTLANGTYTGNSFRQKPYRQRSVPYIIDYAKKLQDNMGSTRMAPFSPDLPMYTQPKKLVADLLEQVSDEVDAASMRVDDFIADNTFILLQVHGGMDSVTLGVEGNSQRMRDLVGKGTSDADVKEAVTRGIRAGIRKFKLFMISNLPGEDEGDVYRILKLAKDLADIRESMGQPTVRIQFSWTPLMIEANTPFQWFAPQPANRILGDVWEEFRDLKIDFKIGSKSEPNKSHFFQLCQRASRDVGEALVDAMLEADQACWGGVPRNFKDVIQDALHRHGFDNGYADCFDERFKHDMFGWEFIDQGISNELLWQTYVQMREFVEQTDSHSYDLNFDSTYHGSEWVMRCDERCYGKSCGVCDHTDLKERAGYIRAVDRDIDLSTIQSVDQHSQAVRIRARLTKTEALRFVGNDHWRFLFRRACFRAQTRLAMEHGIAKRSIRFASDEVKYRDWTAGTDYVEFALTRPTTDLAIAAFLRNVDLALEGRMTLGEWTRHPVDAVTIRADAALTLFDVEVDADYDTASQRLTWWNDTTDIPMRLKVEGGYFAPGSETVNAKDYVDDLWLRTEGHHLHLRMLVHGRPNPYNIVAALMGKPSWLPYAAKPAHRVDVFIATDRHQQDFLRPVCTACGLGIPITLLDKPYHPELCPRCLDESETACPKTTS
jgi:radical SAM superfamily enzyme YgiQ (UPF0313 family)